MGLQFCSVRKTTQTIILCRFITRIIPISILLDYNGVAIAGIAVQLKQSGQIEEALVRHFILNSIRATRSKFVHGYGELLICCDGPTNWRKEIFPYYKANRKKNRDKQSLIDWHALFASMDTIRNELMAVFPYKVLQVPRAEADDIIAVLARTLPGPHMVVSKDKDLIQLQQYKGVENYDPRLGRKVRLDRRIELHVREHIIRGDKGDGIPNIMSDDDTLVVKGKRQKPMRESILTELMSEVKDEQYIANFKRNQELIDLDCIPADIEAAVIKAHDEAPQPTRKNLLTYFIQKGLRNLVANLDEF
jgi:hypothetical protein